MIYTVKQLAEMAGISSRTLRYYHEIGLLVPQAVSEAGYRLYGKEEVNQLQQILFYKELGLELERIKEILSDPAFNRQQALQNHLAALLKKRIQINALIDNVSKTLVTMKGDGIMTDQEKFEGFKREVMENNEKTYGKEIRAKYGNETVDQANQKWMATTEGGYQNMKELEQEIKEKLKEAMHTGDSEGPLAQKVCMLHKMWISACWPEGLYTPEAHKNLAQSYIEDERFKAYYESIMPGAAQFLRGAIWYYCKE